jgi:hypothetical protein
MKWLLNEGCVMLNQIDHKEVRKNELRWELAFLNDEIHMLTNLPALRHRIDLEIRVNELRDARNLLLDELGAL